MKRKFGKKAQGSSSIGVIAGVVIALIIGGAFLALTIGIGTVSTGTISTAQCKASIEAINSYNSAINAKQNQAKDALNCDWFSGDAGKACWNPARWPSVVVGATGGNAIVDGTANLLKINADLCLQNIEDRCPILLGQAGTTADAAAECLYKHAVTTFYTLQGGRSNPKLLNDQGDPFNLYKLTVKFENPGSILLNGQCSIYVVPSINGGQGQGGNDVIGGDKTDCAKVVLGGARVCAKQAGNQCNVTFGTLDENTMTLTMVSRCQDKGPDSSACKCFVDPAKGYSTFNGLPSKIISPTSQRIEYSPADKYGKYSACGANTETPFPITIGEGASQATIYENNIDASLLNINANQDKICYLRLRTIAGSIGGDSSSGSHIGVAIEGETSGSKCGDAPAPQQQGGGP